MMLVNFQLVGQGPTALAVGAGGVVSLSFLLFSGRRPDID